MELRIKLLEAIGQYEEEDKMKSFIIDEDDLLGEDYPEAFSVTELEAQKSYAAKKRYLAQHLKKIGAGTAREVYLVDNTKVLKLAKNDKGVAQNSVESQGFIQQRYSDVVAQVFASDDNDYWIEMELARKTTPNRFKELTGFDFKKYGEMLRFVLDGISYGQKPSQELVDAFYDHPFAGEITQMSQDLTMVSGDLIRISGYGEVNRNGKPTVVLVDYGLDAQTYEDYYKPKRRY